MSLCGKFSYLHEFDLYENEPVPGTHFNMNGLVFAALKFFFLVSTAEHSMTFSDAEEQINDAELL